MDIDPEDAVVKTYKSDPREVFVMRATKSVELAPSYVRGIRGIHGSDIKQEMVCEGFPIRNHYCNNIVLLTGDRVMYCVNFQEFESSNPAEKGMSRFGLKGFFFDCVKPVWEEPTSSARIGLFHVSKLNLFNLHSVSAMDLVSKCFISVRGHKPGERVAVDPLPADYAVILRQYQESRDEKTLDAVGTKLRAEAARYKSCDPSYLTDYWWVQSIVQPGHYTNYFQ